MKGFFQDGNALLWERNYEKMRIEPWGTDSLRIRASMGPRIQMDLPTGLIDLIQSDAQIEIGPEQATIRNGDITAVVLENGDMRFINSAGITLLEEELKPNHQSNWPAARWYQAVPGELWKIEVRFKPIEDEKLVVVKLKVMIWRDCSGR